MLKKPFLSVLLLSALLLASSCMISAQEQYNESIYRAFLKADMNSWKAALPAMEKLLGEKPEEELLFDLALSYYGLIGYYVSEEMDDEASEYLEKLDEHLDKLLEGSYRLSAVNALKGAAIGFYISLRPARAIFLGPKSQRYLNTSMELDNTEPMAWIEGGNSLFYRPAMFGGSKEEALEYYTKAITLFEKDSMAIKKNWVYLNAIFLQAKCYEALEDYKTAADVYRRILSIEPDFVYIRNEMLPALEEKIR